MADQISEKDEDFALHQLNDDCLLKIFDYLSFNDVRSLGRATDRLKNLSMIRCHKFTFEFHSRMWWMENGDKLIDDFLLEYGEDIRSWSLTIHNDYFEKDWPEKIIKEVGHYGFFENDYTEKIIKEVGQCSKNLKSLNFKDCQSGIPTTVRDSLEVIDCFDNVELLSFKYCNLHNHSDFLQRFRKLKHLRLIHTEYKCTDLQIMFRNNPGMESFVGGNHTGVFGEIKIFAESINLLEFGPKFEKLCLYVKSETVQMDLLLPLAATNLTTLKLHMRTENLDIFLKEMSKKGILKELELRGVELNRSAFDTLQSFDNLELLVLWPGCYDDAFELDSTLIWPRHLKQLLLNLPITERGFFSLIRQLKYLTRLEWKRVVKRGEYWYLSNIPDLHEKLENIAKEGLSRPTLNINFLHHTFVYPQTYIVDYQAMTVTCIEEANRKYIGIAFEGHYNFLPISQCSPIDFTEAD